MRVSLWTHPKVVTLSSQLSVTRAHVIGALHCAWGIADQHADEFGVVSLTSELLDRLTETPGFSAAMGRVGWMTPQGESMQFVDYQEHNGTTAKQRADAQKRQRLSRNRHNSVTEPCDKTVTREEKRREEKKKTPKPPEGADVGFDQFWKVYPKKTNKPAAIRAWKLIQPGEALLARIVAHVESSAKTEDWTKENRRYVPNPAAYLNGRRWEDQTDSPKASETDPELARRYAPPRSDDDL
jgi:hypothetical protein